MWPSWNQAAVATAVLLVVTARARRQPGPRPLSLATGEMALVSFLYMLWRLARKLPFTREAGAYDRARALDDLERALHLPSELTIEKLVLPHGWLAEATNAFYATAHVPTLVAFLVWLYMRHRNQYGRWRNALAILTGLCLVIRFVRVAPPRLLPDLGYVDLAARHGQSVYGPAGTGVSDQFAAMPSIHVGWAMLVGIGAICASTSRGRYLVLLHPIVTALVVVATANHWWLDGAVSVGLLGLALAVDSGARRLAASVRTRRPPDQPLTSGRPSPGTAPVASELGPSARSRYQPAAATMAALSVHISGLGSEQANPAATADSVRRARS